MNGVQLRQQLVIATYSKFEDRKCEGSARLKASSRRHIQMILAIWSQRWQHTTPLPRPVHDHFVRL